MVSGADNNKIKVLLVDDEEFFLRMTAEALVELGIEAETASSGEEGLDKLATGFFDVMVLDIRMPGMDGMSVLRKLQEERPTQQVIMLTGQATVNTAIEAMKLGAFDFLLKPCKVDDLLRVIRRAAEKGRLERRNIVLEDELERTKGTGDFVGESQATREVHEFIKRAALSDLPVLITGESGTGKELVARGIHARSTRSTNSLVVVDGSTLREELLASELFGHEKGAFTGAVRKKAGLFEIAHHGSIFLDEIGEMSAANQAALLRVIEYGTFRPLGAVKEVKTDVRIIAATNKNLSRAVESGEFRQDLFFRLNALAIEIPPLRDRSQDMEILLKHFLTGRNLAQQTRISISDEALQALKSHHWPGNVRELRYVVELAALMAADEGAIHLSHLPQEIRKGATVKSQSASSVVRVQGVGWNVTIPDDDLRLSEFQDICVRNYIQRLLDRFGGNKSRVAKALGISRPMLYEKIRRLGIK